MAGPLIVSRVLGQPTLTCALISGATATTAGEWRNVEGFWSLTCHVTATNATVQLRGSQQATTPTGNGVLLGTSVTGQQIVTLADPLKWVKAMVTARTGGTITVQAFGRGAGA